MLTLFTLVNIMCSYSLSLPVLLEAVQSGGDLAEASRAAVVAGRESVAGLGEPEGERSATTFLSVVAARDDVTVCWLGDSRAYWLAPTESESVQLTRDDSVAGGMVTPAWPARKRPWPCPTHTC